MRVDDWADILSGEGLVAKVSQSVRLSGVADRPSSLAQNCRLHRV